MKSDEQCHKLKIRNSARAIIINEKNEVLLQKFIFRQTIDEKILWVTPGGGVKSGETYKQTLARELNEELGWQIMIKDSPIFENDVLINSKNGDFISHEVYYLILINSSKQINLSHMTNNEQNSFYEIKWFSYSELKSIDNYAPIELLTFLEGKK